MNYVYSTLTNGQSYASYTNSNGMPRIDRQVNIDGGANVANKRLITPLGVATKVNDDDLEFLNRHPVFKRHMDRGFIKISRRNVDPEVAVADMQNRDDSSPLKPGDFQDGKNGKLFKGDIKAVAR